VKNLSRIKLVYQISLIGLAAIVLFAVVGVVLYGADQQRRTATVAAAHALSNKLLVDDVSRNFLTTRQTEKDFLLKLDEKFVAAEAKTVADVRAGLSKLAADPDLAQFSDQISQVSSAFDGYANTFQKVVELQRTIGLETGGGLKGQLASAADKVEKAIDGVAKFEAMLGLSQTKDLSLAMSRMRGTEKDFLMHPDPSYIDTMDQALAGFLKQLAATGSIKDDKKADIANLMKSYVADFKSLSQTLLEREKALDQLDISYGNAEPVLEQLSAGIGEYVGQMQDRAEAISRTGLMVTIAIFIGGALILAVVSIWLSRAIARAISGLTRKMTRLADNDFGIDLSEADRKDEIGEMGRAVLVFRENAIARQRFEEDQRNTEIAQRERLEAQERHIREFDADVVTMLGEVEAAVGQLHRVSGALRENAEAANSQSQNVSAGSEAAASNMQLVSTAATQLSSSIREIAGQVTQTSEMAKSATSRAQTTNQNIQGLNDAAVKIGEVISLISEIAGQTNLLALNATIEAARAGDAGKGFAVVAQEVKNLASQTAKATEDITSQISDIQAATRVAVEAIEEIVKMISDINERASAVAAAVEQQTAATGEISQNVEQAAHANGEISAAMGDVTHAVSQTSEAANEVRGSAENLGTQNDGLRQRINRFLDGMRKL
jgi:methyl-accepting chemotaxis protein